MLAKVNLWVKRNNDGVAGWWEVVAGWWMAVAGWWAGGAVALRRWVVGWGGVGWWGGVVKYLKKNS